MHLIFISEAEGFDNKHELPAVVYCWGGGLVNPTILPLPGKSDVEVTQVALGRTSKTGVTSKGRLIIWEVSLTDVAHFKFISEYFLKNGRKLK